MLHFVGEPQSRCWQSRYSRPQVPSPDRVRRHLAGAAAPADRVMTTLALIPGRGALRRVQTPPPRRIGQHEPTSGATQARYQTRAEPTSWPFEMRDSFGGRSWVRVPAGDVLEEKKRGHGAGTHSSVSLLHVGGCSGPSLRFSLPLRRRCPRKSWV